MSSDNPFGADNQQERPDIAQWVVGFVDGEGCFSAPIFKNRASRLGWQVQPEFSVVQGEKSIDVLHRLKQYFGYGYVGRNGRHDNHKEDLYRFNVRSRSDLSVCIIPFFKANPLVTAKREDFEKFSMIVAMMHEGLHLTNEGVSAIATIASTMNRRKASRFLESSEAIRQPS